MKWREQIIRNRARLDQLRAANAEGLRQIPSESLTGILEAVVMTADLLDLVLRLAACELSERVNDRTESELNP